MSNLTSKLGQIGQSNPKFDIPGASSLFPLLSSHAETADLDPNKARFAPNGKKSAILLKISFSTWWFYNMPCAVSIKLMLTTSLYCIKNESGLKKTSVNS